MLEMHCNQWRDSKFKPDMLLCSSYTVPKVLNVQFSFPNNYARVIMYN